MSLPAIDARPPTEAPALIEDATVPARRRDRRALAWATVGLGVLAVAVAWILATRMRPSYDAFGWLDWGRQTLHWDLNLDGAPSWKPLTFLFTLPYALAGPNPQVWLWMITATAAAAGAPVFAGRIAYHLTGEAPERPWAPWIAGALAGIGAIALNGFAHQVLIANSDPMVETLCLAAADAHLHRRRRLTLILLVLAGLGRPEAWALVVVYAAYCRRARKADWPLAAGSLLVTAAAWFIIPGLTSHSWFSAGDHALGSAHVITGSKLIGVIDRLRSLSAPPAQLAVLAALVLAVMRRSRAWLELFAAAALWVAVEVAFAYHGWSAVSRYLLEPGAILVVLAATGAGWVLAYRPPAPRAIRRLTAVAEVAAVVALIVALVPAAEQRVRSVDAQLPIAHKAAKEMTRLESVIARLGGASRIKACGQPVTLLGYQSEVAWAVGESVGNVGFQPGASIRSGRPIVLLKPHDDGWQIRPYNTSGPCRLLDTDSAMD